MREPAFWWRPAGLAAALLAPAAAIYGTVAGARMRRSGRRVGIPVVCVGNLTVGGAGKTPTALAIARLLLADGRRPFFLTRGYGGSLAGPVEVVAAHSAAEVGDEPLLLARVAPTIVARDRVAGAALAAARGADVIVMDDGLQNPALVYDFALAVVDGRRGLGNARMIPAGPLRAPLDDQLGRAHAVLLVGEAGGAATLAMDAANKRGLPLLRARLEADEAALATLSGKRVLAFAGIGDPDKFFMSLAAAGVEAPVALGFPDHHPYTAADAARLVETAERDKLSLLTTEKDLARMQGDAALATLRERTEALPVTLVFADPAQIRRRLAALVRSP